MKRKLSKRYKVRGDKAITMSDDVLELLQWKIDDELEFEIDFQTNALTITKAAASEENGSVTNGRRAS